MIPSVEVSKRTEKDRRAAPMDEGRTSSRDRGVLAFRLMLLARILDDKFASLYRGGKIHGGVFLGRGQEALSVATGLNLKEGDVFAPLIRDGAGRLAFGEEIVDAVRNYLGSSLGPMRGRDGNVHRGDPKRGYLPMISHLGAMTSVVNGALMAKRMRGESGFVGVSSLGEGATSTGAFHESLNQAAVERLPLVMVVANNQYAYSTPTDRQFACKKLADRALGYGIQSHEVDGTDLFDCLKILQTAIEAARRGEGPQMVVASLLRLCGHGEHDDAHYIDEGLKSSPLGRDCLAVAREALLAKGLASPEEIEQWRAEFKQNVAETVAQVQQEPVPDPFQEVWCALSTRRLAELQDASTQPPHP